jgi:hypothetical protein
MGSPHQFYLNPTGGFKMPQNLPFVCGTTSTCHPCVSTIKKTRGPVEETIKVGDVVQIHSENKRSSWKLAVVENLIRSADGKVRAADIRTAKGKTNRPINKLYPLEITEQKIDPVSPNKPAVDSEESNAWSEAAQQAVNERPARRAAAEKASRRISSIAQLESIDETEE